MSRYRHKQNKPSKKLYHTIPDLLWLLPYFIHSSAKFPLLVHLHWQINPSSPYELTEGCS